MKYHYNLASWIDKFSDAILNMGKEYWYCRVVYYHDRWWSCYIYFSELIWEMLFCNPFWILKNLSPTLPQYLSDALAPVFLISGSDFLPITNNLYISFLLRLSFSFLLQVQVQLPLKSSYFVDTLHFFRTFFLAYKRSTCWFSITGD